MKWPLLFALLVFLVGAGAIAQVEPGTWYFEIDGDYGSVLGPPTVPGGYTLPSRNITDGEGANRHTTYAPKQGYRIGVDEPACTDWFHQSSATYMGAQAYGVQAQYPGRASLNPDTEEPRRSEQMLLYQWYPGTDGARYFTLAFRFNTFGTLPATTGGYIAQWHEGGNGPPPIRLSWAYADGTYYLSACVYKDSATERRIWTPLFDAPASPGIWHRMLFQVDLGPGWGVAGCEQCPSDQGLVRAWMMNPETGEWEPWGEEYQGQIGYRYKWEDESPPRRYRTGGELSYQWKVGHYVNETEWIRLDYDNVAYGKRWNAITKNRLIGYKKSVLNLNFDEGTGTVANDTCWSWNGGQQGDATMDYDNDGSLQGNVGWSSDGVGFYRRSLSFNGGYVDVPLDTPAFDFGNYVTVSAWFNTTANAPQLQGLVSIDTDDSVGKLFLARADGLLTFGVRHPDGSYSQVNYNHAPGLYADGRWHHVVGTFNRFTDDNRRVKLYVDGQRVLQREGYDKPILRGDTRLVVGQIGGSGGFVGDIDEVNVLNYTMTDADVAALTAQTLAPATRIWDGGSPSTGTWTADSNWQGNVQPATGDFLVFPTGAARLANTNTFSANKVFGGIIFQGDNYNIYGNAVTLTNHLTAEAGASGNVFRPDIRLGAPSHFSTEGSGLQLTLLGDIDLNGHDLTLLSEGELHCEGAIGGTGDVAKTGSGRVVFSGSQANTYSGTTYVNGGTLVLNKSAVNGAIPGDLVVGDGTGGANTDVVRTIGGYQIANGGDVTVNSSGLLDISGSSADETIGSLAGMGNIELGAKSLGVNHNDASTLFSGLISGTGGRLNKVGVGALTLTGHNTYSGTTTVSDGTLLVNGAQPASDVLIERHGTLGGTGAVGRLTSTGGALSPGLSPGTLTSSNALLDSTTDFVVELASADSDRLNVRGKVGLSDAHLVLSAPGLLPAEGQQFVILDNDDTDTVTGTFASLAEGAVVSAGPRRFCISYAGGSGNDVVLTATNTAALRPILAVWPTDTNSVVVSWPVSDIAWLLHFTTNLVTGGRVWMKIPPPYPTNLTDCTFIELAPAGQKFFRLHKP